MDETMIALDRIVSSVTPQSPARGYGCGGGCACPRCRTPRFDPFDGMEAARKRRAKPARAPGRPARGGTTARAARVPELRNWRGWSPAVTLAQIRAAQAQARAGKPITDPVMRRMLAKGGQVYRLTRAKLDRDRALTIGATLRTGDIATRVNQHYANPKRGDRDVWQAIHNLPPDQIYVQAGIIADRDRHNRRTKLYENWLQVRERPLIYKRDTITFEEAEAGRSRGCACGR